MKKHILLYLFLSLSACSPHSDQKQIRIHHNNNPPTASIITHVTLTCYQHVASQCDSDPLTTSDGSKINLSHLKSNKIRWCAISQDLLYLFPKGKKKLIWIEGYGIYEVRDVMNRNKHHHVDILQHPSNSTMILKKGVKIKIL